MIVLDTHVIIWDALAPERLSERAREAIAEANREEGVIIADISLWEIAMLLEKKRVQVAMDSRTFLELLLQANRTAVQGITGEIANVAAGLPAEVSRDPADRLIAATAIVRGARLVTADGKLREAGGVETVW